MIPLFTERAGGCSLKDLQDPGQINKPVNLEKQQQGLMTKSSVCIKMPWAGVPALTLAGCRTFESLSVSTAVSNYLVCLDRDLLMSVIDIIRLYSASKTGVTAQPRLGPWGAVLVTTSLSSSGIAAIHSYIIISTCFGPSGIHKCPRVFLRVNITLWRLFLLLPVTAC